jgi:hypothetical protein
MQAASSASLISDIFSSSAAKHRPRRIKQQVGMCCRRVPLPQHDGKGPGHIAFGVSSAALGSWRARLAKHNVEILKEVTWERGARSLYFRDPDGHMLELATPGIWEPK